MDTSQHAEIALITMRHTHEPFLFAKPFPQRSINMHFRRSFAIALLTVFMLAGCNRDLFSSTTSETAPSTQKSGATKPVDSVEGDSEGNERADQTPESSSSDQGTNGLNEQSPQTPNPNTRRPNISAEAFRLAAYEGDLSKVKTATESGMDVNSEDPTQKLTALHMAAYNGHTEIVNYLIQNGATVDCLDREKKTPLIHACTGPFSATVTSLIKAGANVNATDGTEGFTPLMMAAGLGQSEIVEILLANKAKVSQKDTDEETAIDHARNAGHDDIVKRLESYSQK